MPRWTRLSHLLLAVVVLACASVVRAEEGDYADNQDGTITDTKHAIMWQKADDGVERSWMEAAGYCESLEFAGHTDWTLPKAYQLEGLINTAYSPTIDPVFSVKASYYWSATESTNSGDLAKYVNFFYGNTYTYSKNKPYYALCVREAKTIPGRKLTVIFTGRPEVGNPMVIRFTPTVTGGSEPYFYEWEFGDGSTSSASAPTHEFTMEGRYKVFLTVSDNNGAVAAVNQLITLPLAEIPAAGQEKPAKPPVVPEGTVPVIAGPAPTTAGMPSGILEVLASGKGAPYKDGALGHGLLAYSFAKAMAGDGDTNKDGSVTASEIQAYLVQSIKSLSKDRQSPEVTLDGNDFPVCVSPGSTFVLAIGISHDLAGAPLAAGQDAELVRGSVEGNCQYTKTMMLSADHANRQDILAALLRIGSEVTASDTLVVYVGAANGQDNGRLNWYVNDSSEKLSGFSGIYHEDLVNFLKTMPVGHLMILGEKN